MLTQSTVKPFNKPEPKEPKKRRPRNNTKLMTQKKPGETTHAKKWRSQMSSSLSGGRKMYPCLYAEIEFG